MPGGNRGFTLLEVLVALVLTGLVLITVGTVQERQVNAQWQLEERIAAAQLAWNLMESFRLEGAPEQPAHLEEQEEMAGWTFPWRREVVATDAEGERRVDILVGPVEAPLYRERWYWILN